MEIWVKKLFRPLVLTDFLQQVGLASYWNFQSNNDNLLPAPGVM